MREPKEIIREFLKEIQGHLEKLEEKFFKVKACVQEKIPVADEDVNEMFHAAHTIKGAASLVGLSRIVNLAHELGTMFRCMRQKKIAFTKEIADLFFQTLEMLKALRNDLAEKGREVTDAEEVILRIKELLKSETFSSSQDKGAEAGDVQPKSLSVFPEIDEKYLGVYLDDIERNIECFNHDLVGLERDPADMDLINNLFRIMHTIKGSSGMVNVTQVQKVAHAMESVFSMVRDRKEAFPDMFSLLFQGIDVISTLVLSLRRREPLAADVTPVLRDLEDYVRGLTSGKSEMKKKAGGDHEHPKALDSLEAASSSRQGRDLLTEAVNRKSSVYRIMLSMEENTPLKSMKAMVIEEHLKNKGTIAVMTPSPDLIDDAARGVLEIGILFISALKEKEIRPLVSVGEVNIIRFESVAEKDIQEALAKSSEAAQPAKDSETAVEKKDQGGGTSAAAIRIDARKLDTLMNLSGELVTVRAQFERLTALLHNEVLSQRDFTRLISGVRLGFQLLSRDLAGVAGEEKALHSRRILQQLERMGVCLGDLEENTGRSNFIAEIHSLDEMTGILGKIASDIQTAVMQARMVPIKGVFTRFNRIVRDIAKDLGKDVQLVLEGEETELDKNLVDSLGDPLTHMVRNAIDHGIEDPAARKKSGKPLQGTIWLKAFHEGNNVCIEVADDGKGLDPDVLARSALKKKLITADQFNRLTNREKLDLMFLPGFSTAAEVTNLSGRGVGMDVVRNMIVAMNGAIDIQSEVGKGTAFILKIPLTLAIIQALLVIVDGETYAIPLEAVTEIIKITEEMIYSIDGNDTVKLRDQVLSLVELRDVLRTKGTPRPEENTKRVVVITDGNSQVGVIVDRMIGETEIVIKSLTPHFFNVKGISGVTILGDGQISLILDPKLIIMQTR